MSAIETSYRGVRFRSRLEARWAVFFDAAGIEWEYEPEGFEAHGFWPSGQGRRWRYLPDFILPKVSHPDCGPLYVEVKGSDDALDVERMKKVMFANIETLGRGVLLLGPVPKESPGFTPSHSIAWIDPNEGGFKTSPAVFLGKTSARVVHRPFYGLLGPTQFTCESVLLSFSWGNKSIGDLFRREYSEALSARFEHGEAPNPAPRLGVA